MNEQRQIVLDTETTGLNPEEGHRIIEIGCIELINRKFTGKTQHFYINPDRAVDAGALAVHGISQEFLSNKPRFAELAKEILDFISGAELIIHNAAFDVGFLNHEFKLWRNGWTSITSYCQILDTLIMARKRYVGQRNSLDALCKRLGVDNTKRELHGALLDAHLLAQVYLAMTGGQGSFFDAHLSNEQSTQHTQMTSSFLQKSYPTPIVLANEIELCEHDAYLQELKTKGNCIWLDD